jgi:hypothetical protein
MPTKEEIVIHLNAQIEEKDRALNRWVTSMPAYNLDPAHFVSRISQKS